MWNRWRPSSVELQVRKDLKERTSFFFCACGDQSAGKMLRRVREIERERERAVRCPHCVIISSPPNTSSPNIRQFNIFHVLIRVCWMLFVGLGWAAANFVLRALGARKKHYDTLYTSSNTITIATTSTISNVTFLLAPLRMGGENSFQKQEPPHALPFAIEGT